MLGQQGLLVRNVDLVVVDLVLETFLPVAHALEFDRECALRRVGERIQLSFQGRGESGSGRRDGRSSAPRQNRSSRQTLSLALSTLSVPSLFIDTPSWARVLNELPVPANVTAGQELGLHHASSGVAGERTGAVRRSVVSELAGQVLNDGVVGSHKVRDGLRHFCGIGADCRSALAVFGAAPTRFKVRPATVFAIVLPALLMGTPSTVNEASVPVAPLVKVRPLLDVVDRQVAGRAGRIAHDRQASAVGVIDHAGGDTQVRIGDGRCQSIQSVVGASIVMVAAGWLPT